MALEKILAIRTNKTIYMDKDKCVKVFQTNYPKDDILNEALNQARIEKTEIKMPRICGVMMVEGNWAIVSDFIKGKTIKALMKEDPDNMDKYMDMFVDTQLFIHNSRKTSLNHQKDKLARKINDSILRDEAKFDLLTRLESLPISNYICHGDYNPENVIVDPKGVCYTIDWAHVTEGNTYGDIARTYLLFILDGRKDLAEKYYENYSSKRELDRKEFQRWLPIIAASELTRCKEKDRDILLEWVKCQEF